MHPRFVPVFLCPIPPPPLTMSFSLCLPSLYLSFSHSRTHRHTHQHTHNPPLSLIALSLYSSPGCLILVSLSFAPFLCLFRGSLILVLVLYSGRFCSLFAVTNSLLSYPPSHFFLVAYFLRSSSARCKLRASCVDTVCVYVICSVQEAIDTGYVY